MMTPLRSHDHTVFLARINVTDYMQKHTMQYHVHLHLKVLQTSDTPKFLYSYRNSPRQVVKLPPQL